MTDVAAPAAVGTKVPALSIEVTDQLRGRPAAGLRCRVARTEPSDGTPVFESLTGPDGFVRVLGADQDTTPPCSHRITLDTGSYYGSLASAAPLENVSFTLAPCTVLHDCRLVVLLAPQSVQVVACVTPRREEH